MGGLCVIKIGTHVSPLSITKFFVKGVVGERKGWEGGSFCAECRTCFCLQYKSKLVINGSKTMVCNVY